MKISYIKKLAIGMTLLVLLGCEQDNPLVQRLDNVTAALSRQDDRYGAYYASDHSRWRVTAGEAFSVPITVQNTGSLPWQVGTEQPFNLGYHWLLVDETPLPGEAGRVPLPRQVLPGEKLSLQVIARAPERRGIYTLRVGLVHEGVVWFSDAGVVPLELTLLVE